MAECIPEIGSVWHEQAMYVRDMDHGGRMYEVTAVRSGFVTLDQPQSFKDAGLRLAGQRRTTMRVERLLKQFSEVKKLCGGGNEWRQGSLPGTGSET